MATTRTSLTSRYTTPQTPSDVTRRTTIGVSVAIVTLLVIQGVIGVLGIETGGSGAQDPFALGPIVASTIAAGVGAALAYSVLIRFTESPVRNFVVLSVVVFAAMMIPVVVVAPTLGVTPVGQVVLTVFHLAVAVPIVGSLIGAIRV